MHKPDEKEGEKEIGKKGTKQEKNNFFFKTCNLFNRLMVKLISRVDDVFDYYWCVLKQC